MPVTAVILVRVPEPIPDDRLLELRQKLLHHLDDDAEDYHDPPLLRDEFVGVAFAYLGPPSIWYNLNTTQNYYGPGYERGYAPRLIETAEWLERNIPGDCTIWYGADCDDNALPFGPRERAAMMTYWREHACRPYDTLMQRNVRHERMNGSSLLRFLKSIVWK